MKPTLEEGNRLLCIDEYNAENKEIKFDVENQKLQVDFGDGTGYHDVGSGGGSGGGSTPEAEEYDRTKSYPEGSLIKAPRFYSYGEPSVNEPEQLFYVWIGELPPISDEDWQTHFVNESYATLRNYFGYEQIPGYGSFPKLQTVQFAEQITNYGPNNASPWDLTNNYRTYLFGAKNENIDMYGYQFPYSTPGLVNITDPETQLPVTIKAPHPYMDMKNGRIYVDGGLGNSLARVTLSLPAVSWEANSDAETSTAYPYKITVNQSVGNKFRENFASGEISIIPSLTAAQSVAGDIAFVEANSIVYNDSSDVATLQFTVYSKNNSAPASDIDFKAVIIVDHNFDESVWDPYINK